MRRLLGLLPALGLLLAACAPAPPVEDATSKQENTVPATLPAGPLAPELTSETWLNTKPLTGGDLRGHVVLIDFWTFG